MTLQKIDLRERVAMPASVIVASLGMVAMALPYLLTAVSTAITHEYAAVGAIVLGLVFSIIPALAVWGLRRGWKLSPVLVTLVGLWAATALISFDDVMSFAMGVAGIAATVAVWLPSARRYRVARRAARAAS